MSQCFAQEQDELPPVTPPNTAVWIITTVHIWACFGGFLESISLHESHEIILVLQTLKSSSR